MVLGSLVRLRRRYELSLQSSEILVVLQLQTEDCYLIRVLSKSGKTYQFHNLFVEPVDCKQRRE